VTARNAYQGMGGSGRARNELAKLPRVFLRRDQTAGVAATKMKGRATVIAVYLDHATAEEAVRLRQQNGIPMVMPRSRRSTREWSDL
jgi:hypothetical protein